MGLPLTSDINMGQQIFLKKFVKSTCFVDKITYIDDEMSKFVNKKDRLAIPVWLPLHSAPPSLLRNAVMVYI